MPAPHRRPVAAQTCGQARQLRAVEHLPERRVPPHDGRVQQRPCRCRLRRSSRSTSTSTSTSSQRSVRWLGRVRFVADQRSQAAVASSEHRVTTAAPPRRARRRGAPFLRGGGAGVGRVQAPEVEDHGQGVEAAGGARLSALRHFDPRAGTPPLFNPPTTHNISSFAGRFVSGGADGTGGAPRVGDQQRHGPHGPATVAIAAFESERRFHEDEGSPILEPHQQALLHLRQRRIGRGGRRR